MRICSRRRSLWAAAAASGAGSAADEPANPRWLWEDTFSIPVESVNPEISWIRVMIAQYIGFTRDFLKASRIHDYGQLKKIPCGTKRQARARVIHEISGLNCGHGG
jgi:hypothetical protein